MSRRPGSKPGAKYRSPEWKARVSAGLRRSAEQRRRRATLLPADLRALEAGHPVREELRPLAEDAARELVGLVEHVGGEEASVVELALAQSAARLGIAERGLAMQYAQTGDPELATRLGTVAGQRRALLVALGLKRRASDPFDVTSYSRALAERDAAQRAARDAIDLEPEAQPAPEDDRGSREHDEHQSGSREGEGARSAGGSGGEVSPSPLPGPTNRREGDT